MELRLDSLDVLRLRRELGTADEASNAPDNKAEFLSNIVTTAATPFVYVQL